MPVHVLRGEKEKPKSCTLPFIKYRTYNQICNGNKHKSYLHCKVSHFTMPTKGPVTQAIFGRRRKSGTSTSAVAVGTAEEEPLLRRKPQFLRRRIFESGTSAFADYFVLPFLTKKNLQKVAVLETSL